MAVGEGSRVTPQQKPQPGDTGQRMSVAQPVPDHAAFSVAAIVPVAETVTNSGPARLVSRPAATIWRALAPASGTELPDAA